MTRFNVYITGVCSAATPQDQGGYCKNPDCKQTKEAGEAFKLCEVCFIDCGTCGARLCGVCHDAAVAADACTAPASQVRQENTSPPKGALPSGLGEFGPPPNPKGSTTTPADATRKRVGAMSAGPPSG